MKRYSVRVTDPAERDLRENYAWWAANRSAEQAARWLFGIRDTILSLDTMPNRHGHADERDLLKADVR